MRDVIVSQMAHKFGVSYPYILTLGYSAFDLFTFASAWMFYSSNVDLVGKMKHRIRVTVSTIVVLYGASAISASV